MAHHDFGTVLIHEASGSLDVDFLRNDAPMRDLMRQFKARFDPNTSKWRIEPERTRATAASVVDAVRSALVKVAPAAWNKALPTLREGAVVTTRRFMLVIAEGGVRVRLAPGHRHEYLLRELKDTKAFQTFQARQEWRIPSTHCINKEIREVLADMLKDDREALSKMIDYMAGYMLVGGLDMLEGEADSLGLKERGTVFANPSFVRKADASVGKENLVEYPFTVNALTQGAEGIEARLAFLTGEAGWTALRGRYAQPEERRGPALDTKHLSGTWVRKRA